jgi:hypothetical protein
MRTDGEEGGYTRAWMRGNGQREQEQERAGARQATAAEHNVRDEGRPRRVRGCGPGCLKRCVDLSVFRLVFFFSKQPGKRRRMRGRERQFIVERMLLGQGG